MRRPKVAVLSTGDELTALGQPLRPGAVYDSNGAIIAAAVREAGGEPVAFGAFPDDEAALEAAVRKALHAMRHGGALRRHLERRGRSLASHRLAPRRARRDRARRRAQTRQAALPRGRAGQADRGAAGLSDLGDLHLPRLRGAGDPRQGRPAAGGRRDRWTRPCRCAFRPRWAARNSCWWRWSRARTGPIAFPIGKGSGSVTTFSQADGFLEVDALRTAVDAGTRAQVTLIGQARAPDLVIAGSHCVALDAVLSALSAQGISARTIAIGSMGGVAAARRGECDLAPIHLMDPATGIYNEHYAKDGLALVRGWQRMQGIVFRKGDARFEGKTAQDALKAALADPRLHHGQPQRGRRHAHPDRPAARRARPPGYGNQPRSHNAVAAAVAQGRADWGVAIQSVAAMYGLGFLQLSPENYDFLLVEARRERPAVAAFLKALADPAVRAQIAALGMVPA